MEKIGEIIGTENVFEETVNSIIVRQEKQDFTFKYSITNGEDYWILQHFKMDDIKNVTSLER